MLKVSRLLVMLPNIFAVFSKSCLNDVPKEFQSLMVTVRGGFRFLFFQFPFLLWLGILRGILNALYV